MSDRKTVPTKASIDDYISSLPNERKQKEAYLVVDLLNKITERAPSMWGPSIIGYDRRTYKHGEMPMIAFSPRKTNFVFYIINTSERQQALLSKLGKYRTGKVCLYVNKLADVDMSILEDLLIDSWQHAVKKKNKDND